MGRKEKLMIRSNETRKLRGRSFVRCVVLLSTLAALLAAPLAMAGDRAFLGITSRSLSGRDARNLNLDRRDGALVQQVYSGTAADEGGLKKGDVIIEFDGERVFDDNDLGDMIRDHDAGDDVAIAILRAGKEKTMQVTLGSRDTWSEGQGLLSLAYAPFVPNSGSWIWGNRNRPQIGVNVMDLNSQLADYFEVSDQRGVLVTRVIRSSPAGEAGIQAGDVIVEVAGERVMQSGDIGDALEGRSGETVEVQVIRNGSRREFQLELDGKDND